MNKYEQLLEKTTKHIEAQINISSSLLKVAENIELNTKELNDKFILHNVDTKDIAIQVLEMKGTLLKWVKYLALALFIAVGGASVFKILGSDFLVSLLN